MRHLAISFARDGTLDSTAARLIGALAPLGGSVDLLVLGHQQDDAYAKAAKIEGVENLLIAEDPAFAHPVAEVFAATLAPICTDYTGIVMAADGFGKNFLPRLAALCDCMVISDVLAIEAADRFIRPIYAGNALARVQSTDSIAFLTLRASRFPEAVTGSAMAAPRKSIATILPERSARFVRMEASGSERPALPAARIVVSGGRALASAENFSHHIGGLADTLGAAVGASRAAVDAGYVANDSQVGQTGQIVAPDLYIAVGISGAIQHCAGIKDSGIIVAINKDPEAPIFEIADYGLTGDLFALLPELTEKLKQAKKN